MTSVKLVCGLLFVTFLAYVQAELDIDKLEMDLQNSDWTEEFIEMDDSDEITGRNGKEKSKCSCIDHSTCGCCYNPKVFGMQFKGCINATMHATDTQNVEVIEFKAQFMNQQVSNFNFTIEPYSKMCKSMPVMSFLSVCLYNNNTNSAENGFVTCSSLDLMVRKTAAASLKFSCLQFQDNTVSFFDNKNPGRNFISSLISFKVKSPLQRVVEHMKENNEIE